MNSKVYAPFSLLFFEDRRKASLIHSVFDEKQYIFLEREEEGWVGDGFDWVSVSKVILEEKAEHLIEEIGFDAHEEMMEIYGEAQFIEEFAKILKKIYDNDNHLRDYFSRAKLDRVATMCDRHSNKSVSNYVCN